MKTILKISLCILFFTSCKKYEYEQPVFKPNLGIMCTGIASTSYFPMAIDNEWSYPDGFDGSHKVYIRTTKSVGSYTYFQIGSSGGGIEYYREDPEGNILGLIDSTEEYLVVPGSPVIHQQWSNYPGIIEKVISLDATVVSKFCTYTDCLKIATLDATGDTIIARFYKRGFGLVSIFDYGYTVPWERSLTGLKLN